MTTTRDVEPDPTGGARADPDAAEGVATDPDAAEGVATNPNAVLAAVTTTVDVVRLVGPDPPAEELPGTVKLAHARAVPLA